MPSFILIHPTVWPQYTIVTGRQDRQDKSPIAYRANRFTNGRPKTVRPMLSDDFLSVLFVCLRRQWIVAKR